MKLWTKVINEGGVFALQFERENEAGEAETFNLPARYVTCPKCEGHGTHLRDAIREHAYTPEEFDEAFPDDESAAAYFQRGGYLDVKCTECSGLRVVPEVDLERCEHDRGETKVMSWKRLDSAEGAAELFRPVFLTLPHEEVWMALLDARNSVLGLVRAGQGGLHGCALKPSDVLRPAIAAGASGFILAHNHPSNDPTPSHADIEMTWHLYKASELIGITCLDHLILTRSGGWRSLRDVSGCFED